MPFEVNFDFDLANINEITENDLQDASFTNDLTDKIFKNVEEAATQIYKSGDPEKKDWPEINENLFYNVFIDGKPINTLFEKVNNDGLFNSEMSYKRKMLMISDAIINGKPVDIMPYKQHEREQFVGMNQYCPGIAHKPMGVFQKMLAKLGFTKYKRMALEEQKYKSVENHLKAVGEDLNEQGKWHLASSREKIKKNREFLDNFFTDNEKFNNKQKQQRSQLEKQYFSQIKSDKEIKTPSDLPALLGSNGRDWTSIATLAMLQEGFSLKDACDPNNADAAKARAAVGTMLNDLGKRIKDPIQGPAAKKELFTMLLEGTKKYLNTPMPSPEELFNYKESELPQYCAQMAQIPAELFDPLEKALPTISDDVSDLKIIHQMQEVTFNPAFFNIIKCSNNVFTKDKLDKLDEEAKEGVYIRLAAHELMSKSAKEKSVNASTISEYLKLNQPKANEIDSFNYETALKNYLPELIEQPTNEVMNVRDMFSGKIPIDEMLKKTQHYADSKKTHEAMLASKGTDIENYSARLDLAKTLTDKIFTINNEQPTAQQKYDKVNDLFKNNIFNSSTYKSTPEVKAIHQSEYFVNNLAAQIDTSLKDEEMSLKNQNCEYLAKSALRALYANEKDKYPTKETEEKMIKKIISTKAFQSKISGKTGEEIGNIYASQINEDLKTELTENHKNDEKAPAESKAAVEHQNIKKEENRGMNM